MKAKELMIGDWVRLIADDSKECLKVAYVRKDGVGFECYNHFFDEIEPIPLTEEILKKNDIPYNGELPYPCDHIKICHNDNGWFITFCECYGFNIRYVHELQHALSLCGLNELADNFQV